MSVDLGVSERQMGHHGAGDNQFSGPKSIVVDDMYAYVIDNTALKVLLNPFQCYRY
jgi:hypothetical protein